MVCRISRVWPAMDRTVTPPLFKHATVIAKDARGVEHVLITFSDYMASLCLRYEKRSSTLEPQPPLVELEWDDMGKILELKEVAA